MQWHWWVVLVVSWPYAGMLGYRFMVLADRISQGVTQIHYLSRMWLSLAAGWLMLITASIWLVAACVIWGLRLKYRLLKRIAGYKEKGR